MVLWNLLAVASFVGTCANVFLVVQVFALSAEIRKLKAPPRPRSLSPVPDEPFVRPTRRRGPCMACGEPRDLEGGNEILCALCVEDIR